MEHEKQREKLIELIVNAKRTDPETGSFTEFLADFLLGYGVFVPHDDYDLDRLRELVEADRDGRCVVLPCKVGDELFYSDGEWIGKETVEKIVIDIETGGGIYAPGDIGYSVYKSAEEAEAALKGDQHNG